MRNSSGSKPEKNARKLAKILLAKRNLLFAMRHLAIREAESFYSQSGVFLFAKRSLFIRKAESFYLRCGPFYSRRGTPRRYKDRAIKER